MNDNATYSRKVSENTFFIEFQSTLNGCGVLRESGAVFTLIQVGKLRFFGESVTAEKSLMPRNDKFLAFPE